MTRDLVLIAAAIAALFGIGVLAALTWTILTGRDARYSEAYRLHAAQRSRVLQVIEKERQ